MIDQSNQRVCIVGMGYVGLTLAVVMAESGYHVVGLERDAEKVDVLQTGSSHFFESGLSVRLARQLHRGSLSFTGDNESDAVRACGVFIITVGTPLGADGTPAMDMVARAAGQVASVMPDGALVILRSTVKIGTTRKVVLPMLEASGRTFNLSFCPERTIEGRALEELPSLPQIIGGLGREDAWRSTQLFQNITPTTIRVSSLESAELCKLLDNCYRDVTFSFGNEVALMCEALGLDALEVITAGNAGYPRTSIAKPGLVGGPCLEKDPHILHHSLADHGFRTSLVDAGRAINEVLPHRIVESIEAIIGDRLHQDGAVVSFCGIAFKGQPETDDVRGTPSVALIQAFRERFPTARLRGHDFAVSNDVIASLEVEPATIEQAFADATLVVVSNNNARYERLDFESLLPTLSRPSLVFDCWNCLHIDRASTPVGVTYVRLGSAAAWSR